MSLSVDVKVDGLEEIIQDIEAAGGNAEPLVTAALANSTEHAKQEMRSRAPHATGTLQRSILAEVKYPVGEVSVQEKYGVYVEEGTQPHTPPSSAIERWIKKKGIPGDALWPIIKTIEKQGTKAQPFFKPGWESSQPYVLKQFDKVMDNLMKALRGRGI